MLHYRVYFFHEGGHFDAVHEFQADSDEAAILVAERWLDDRNMELWQSDRKVKRWESPNPRL